MAPAADFSRPVITDARNNSNPIKRAWTEDRIDIPPILLGRGAENASTARFDLEEGLRSQRSVPQQPRNRPRQNSLRNVKNSNEVLRQRSTKIINHKDPPEPSATERKGRHFTVANVGNNGKIYLRPSSRPAQNEPPPSALQSPSDRQTRDSDIDSLTEKKRWSDTEASRPPTRQPASHTIEQRTRRSNSISACSITSLSTLNAETADPGLYKVVINNGIARQEEVTANEFSSLEVPIPHYRLGVPRFGSRGTAILSSAAWSRDSGADDPQSSATTSANYENISALPPGIDANTAMSRIPSENIPQPPANKSVPIRMPVTTIAPVFHKARSPIVPSIYDSISASPDDPSIVRYAMSINRSTREISAASPARIVAQITSKNFLDYELLSDFFLTVRAYLSTNDLLEYLLARFEWAVNRFDDEGRVIRVRAFAAIRHWILNYFPYDFVVDRDLRVKFCDRLNYLSKHVRTQGMEASNLKLIMDLKKCWNGRCALYWDNLSDETETRMEQDIIPGGVVGSRDSQLTHPNELWAKLASSSSHQVDEAKSVAALHNWVDSVIEAEVDTKSKSDRQPSMSASTHPNSQISDQTLPAASCTMPGKNVKSFANPVNRAVSGPHPVQNVQPAPARSARPSAPQLQTKERMSKNKAQHQRSGSLSDALRDKRTSLGAIQEGKTSEQSMMSLPFPGSLVRGSVFPPGSPFIDKLTPQGSGSSLRKESQYAELPPEKLATRPLSPGVRTLLGNIRRAWSSKQSANAPDQTILPPAPFLLENTHPALPIHIAYKIESFGDPNHQLEALKKNARLDLLCADVTDMFERAITQQESGQDVTDSPMDGIDDDTWQTTSYPQRDPLKRNSSGVTNGSRSIVIVDDTSSEPPVPVIPDSYSKSAPQNKLLSNGQIAPTFQPLIPPSSVGSDQATPTSELLPDFVVPKADGSQAGAARSGQSNQNRPSFTTGNSYASLQSSTSLLKYASVQNSVRKSGLTANVDGSSLRDSKPAEDGHAPARTLRRRPGGDLRANQNVHDMESRPRSTGSIRTYAESTVDSSVLSEAEISNLKKGSAHEYHGLSADATPVHRRSISLVHSGAAPKDLRPSFEMAVAEFARIPDHEGGDLEATLAKLEGKFRKSPTGQLLSPAPKASRAAAHSDTSKSAQSANSAQESQESIVTPKNAQYAAKSPVEGTHRGRDGSVLPSTYTGSDESYISVPVIDRRTGDTGSKARKAPSDSSASVPRPLFSPSNPNRPSFSDDVSSFDDSIHTRRGRKQRSSIPTMTTDSFLLDEDEFLSDLSSDLSDEDEEDDEADDEAGSPVEGDYSSSAKSFQNQKPPTASATEFAMGHLPSPPMSGDNARAISSEALRIQEQHKPPTPEPSPVNRVVVENIPKSRTPSQVDDSVLQPFANKPHRFPPRRHIPFILAFDEDLLAQQFTIVERDALNEISWQDLIDMRWHQAAPTVLNWVEYLRYQDPNGIDLVTARFNIVVKWALSEIVLTHNLEERAMTIVKFIRIAQYARKYHNYATLLQLTLALTSVDCTRLEHTWARVPEAERKAMKEMEFLVSPVRNFYNLRAEIEAADLDNGCIPVVALFLHDLTYNAQKPSIIASTRNAEPLINFERYRTSATIVKTLLRLIDASAKYDFKPAEGALERCLWLASLSDDGIKAKSKEIEP